MQRFIGFVAVFFLLPPSLLWGNQDSLLRVLETEIARRPLILAEAKARFRAVRVKMAQKVDLNEAFELQDELCGLYQSFSYDSASTEVQRLLRLAEASGDGQKNARAKIKQAFVLLSAGLFREALDSLERLRVEGMPPRIKSSYFHTKARGYLDLADYCLEPYYQPLYQSKGLAFLDSAIFYARPDTVYFLSLCGLKAIKRRDFVGGADIYRVLLARKDLSTRQLAIEATSASDVFRELGQHDEAFGYLVLGAIADERSCVKETTALMRVAGELFRHADYERANHYINLALEDANFFGARLRKMQIVEVLPLINNRQLALYKENRNNLIAFSVVLGLMLLVCIWLIVLSLRQNRILKNNERTITESNLQLKAFALALGEADHIKEKYIGYFFQSNAKLIDKVEGVIKNTRKSLAEGNVSDAKFYLDQFKASNEQKKLLRDFDRAFLSVFPNFVEQFNELFEEKDHIRLDGDQLLNTELRIFALLRLGITNNEVIAKALDYSVNTIYAYKTKIRNRSFLSSEAFDEAVMQISAVTQEQ